ncbi:MAG: protein-export chaperone SecB [Streptococcus salivarius]|nr:protein-export chaperone SecB [Streptococcus salivarius]
MEKPVIYLRKYEIEEIKLLRNVDISDNERTLNLDLSIGTTESKKEGRVILSSKILDKENRRELFVKLAGYFEINIDKIGDNDPNKFLAINGTSIIYPYLRSFVSMLSSLDSKEAIVLPTVNVLELLHESEENNQK